MPDLTRKRIFLVEDDLNNRIITQMALTPYNVRIEFDRWGRDTMSKLLIFGKPDIIILDLMFPNGISGYDIFDIIRADKSYALVPIVAVSASDAATSIPRCQKKGFSGFIPKPIDPDHFPTQIEKILSGQTIWQGS